MLKISNTVTLADDEIELQAIRAQGSGGQNVNKVSTAIHLRFSIPGSSLPDVYKERLLQLRDQRITKEGVIVIKAQQFRAQEQNREDALMRLQTLLRSVMQTRKVRRPTKPSRNSQRKRVDSKVKRGKVKALRGRISD